MIEAIKYSEEGLSRELEYSILPLAIQTNKSTGNPRPESFDPNEHIVTADQVMSCV